MIALNSTLKISSLKDNIIKVERCSNQNTTDFRKAR